MGRSEMDGRCKRHPEHRQAKGVCPFCLREKLSNISATSSTTTTNASFTSSCSSDSNLSSSTNSPPHQDTKTTWLSLLLKGNPGKSEPLRKSRSLAFVMRENQEEDKGMQKEEGRKDKDEKKKKRKKKGKFWSKLMIGSESRKKEMDGSLSHSRTMKEKLSAKLVLF
ncbi:ataxin-2 [Cocos nucifera]|uniref:Ataxin-2 n=1 Tax=Cocos nucifera TaxID=13894 RepID=A0A8K0HZE7_COCNU|nr:ataxin-2 [Cocos nucifera]